MNKREAISYITATDYLKRQLDKERNLLTARTGRADALPIEAGFKTAGIIYAHRLKTMLVYPAVLATRITGIDVAVRKTIEKKNK